MRIMSDSFRAAVKAKKVRPAVLMEADFPSGSVYLFSGTGSLPVGGNTYLGSGKVLTVDPAQETAALQASNATFQLSGIPEDLISVAINEKYNGHPCAMDLALFDDTDSLIADPVTIFSGRMDTGQLNEPTATFTMTAENDLISLNRTRLVNWTHEEQTADYPDDLGFEFVAAMQNKQIIW